jgi:hypothetical protein
MLLIEILIQTIFLTLCIMCFNNDDDIRINMTPDDFVKGLNMYKYIIIFAFSYKYVNNMSENIICKIKEFYNKIKKSLIPPKFISFRINSIY